jgi:ubiquinol-cytochrome c reductase cytochrome b subunit
MATREGVSSRWWDERLGLTPLTQKLLQRHVPSGLTWWYSLGAATLFVLVLQFVTGILLALNYGATPADAYDSVQYVSNDVPFGWFIRGLHHWGASAMIALVVAHMASAFVLGAHRAPREATWLAGVVLLLMSLAFGFTGYLLPWDQKAYWATTVGTNMAGTVPLIGSALLSLARGGAELGGATLTRFYALHVLILPAVVMIFVAIHIALVVYHGVSVPPGLWSRLSGAYQARYAAAKAKGPRFWPEVITEDLLLALVVFLILIGLTLFVAVPLEERADPTDTAYIPRPEWYFLSLFQLLKLFPGSLDWVGVVVVPGLIVLLLVLAPFLSRGQERRPWKRPLGMATLGVLSLGATVLTVWSVVTTPPATVIEHGAVLSSLQLRGKQLIGQEGCASCHVINGEGGTAGPPLDGIRSRVTAADIHTFMERPAAFNPAASMKPLLPRLSHEDVEAITQYLLTLEKRSIGP